MNIQTKPPSLDLSFDWVKNVLQNQIREVDSLDTKTIGLFSLATLIIGLGVGIPANAIHYLFISVIGQILFGIYVLIAIVASLSLWVRYYERLQNPITIREWYWDIEPLEFKANMLTHLEDAYSANQRKLLLKGWLIRFLVPLIAIETILLILFLRFALYGL